MGNGGVQARLDLCDLWLCCQWWFDLCNNSVKGVSCDEETRGLVPDINWSLVTTGSWGSERVRE